VTTETSRRDWYETVRLRTALLNSRRLLHAIKAASGRLNELGREQQKWGIRERRILMFINVFPPHPRHHHFVNLQVSRYFHLDFGAVAERTDAELTRLTGHAGRLHVWGHGLQRPPFEHRPWWNGGNFVYLPPDVRPDQLDDGHMPPEPDRREWRVDCLRVQLWALSRIYDVDWRDCYWNAARERRRRGEPYRADPRPYDDVMVGIL